MSESEPKERIFYNSLYRHGVDEKRRVQIPAKWLPGNRKQVEFALLLWPKGSNREACLLALPPDRWIALVDKLNEMPYAEPRAEALRGIIGRKSDSVTLDKSGRMCIPEAMARAAGIEGEAVLVGLLDRFQIWNPQRYEVAYAEDEELSSEAFKML